MTRRTATPRIAPWQRPQHRLNPWIHRFHPKPSPGSAEKAGTIAGRLALVQEHALRVFGRADEVDAWMSQYHPAILNGLCPISLACQNPEGFRQTLAELGRISARREQMGWVPPGRETPPEQQSA